MSDKKVSRLHLILLVVAGAALLILMRNLWFFLDDWDFITRGIGRPLDVWIPHDQHWSTIPILVFHGLYELIGLHSFLPYIGVLIGTNLAIARMSWRMMTVAKVDVVLAATLNIFVLFLGDAWGIIIWITSFGFMGSLAFGFAGLLIVNQGDKRRYWLDVVAWIPCVASLMCSNTGIAMVATVGLCAWMRRGWRAGLTVVVVPAIAFIVWYKLFGISQAGVTPVVFSDYVGMPRYILGGLAHTMAQGVTALGDFAWIALIPLYGFLWKRRSEMRGASAPIFATAVGAVIFYFVVGLARISTHAGIQNYYVGFDTALIVPSIGYALTALIRRYRSWHLPVLAATLALTAWSTATLVGHINDRVIAVQESKSKVMASVNEIVKGNLAAVPVHTDPGGANLSSPILEQMVRDHALP